MELHQTTARSATLPELQRNLIPLFLQPTPKAATLRNWFKTIPQFKFNPLAKRGGGPVYYSVSAVEKFLRSRTLPKG
jgi:hypothetical protein